MNNVTKGCLTGSGIIGLMAASEQYTAAPQSELNAQLGILDSLVGELLIKLGALEERLVPVLRPTCQAGSADKASPEEILSPVADAVRGQHKRVGYAITRVESLLGTLAV